MRIGIDIRNIGKQRTGDEVVFFNLTKELAAIDDKNEYLLFTDTSNKEVLHNIKNNLEIKNKNNFKIVSLSKSDNLSISKFVWNLWALPNYLRKYPVDIYHTQYITPFFVSKKIKIINHIHDVSFKVYSKFIKWSDLLFLNILIPISLRRTDKIIAVSEFTKDEIIKYYGNLSDKIEVVYNSTDLIRDKNSTPEEIKKKYNFPEKFILYVGTLQPRKNIPILIESYAKTKDMLSDIKLVLAGDRKAHNFDKKIDNVIKKYNLSKDDVTFCGYIDTKDKFMSFSLAHTVVSPSFYEGFGITPLEAMESGTPVLISDIPPHREVAENAALYFNPADLDELEKKLYTICVDEKLRTQLASLAGARVSLFSWKKSAEKLLGVYYNLLKNN